MRVNQLHGLVHRRHLVPPDGNTSDLLEAREVVVLEELGRFTLHITTRSGGKSAPPRYS